MTVETPVEVIERQLAAYNKHDIEAFMACYSPSVEMRDLPGNRLILGGWAAFRERYEKRFTQNPKLQATIVNRIVFASLVVDHESIRGLLEEDGVFEALVIYEVCNGLIDKVWLGAS